MEVTLEMLEIPTSGSLDSITVFWRNWEPGKGEVTVTCYGSAWTAYFGAMSGDTIQRFFSRADIGYLVNKLSDYQLQKQTRKHREYLSRIVEAIKVSLDPPDSASAQPTSEVAQTS